ncbi:HAD family hydrolase [Neptuniibacter sp. QD37_11]|uniref:HAD family hydrolase n=1 Tax=Neptuniibacter sp. QD37_11 TaxID=3398209 RepID=UPI0039F55292
MHQLYKYDIYIFDCDGVILDSNKLKILAMKDALESIENIKDGIDSSIEYFTNNFGLSRYHHVNEFSSKFLSYYGLSKIELEKIILNNYADFLDKHYVKSEVIAGFEQIASTVNGLMYVASGSEQNQLRRVLEKKNISICFKGIFGSPTKKYEIIRNVLDEVGENKKAVMIGDSIADLDAAKANHIDFIGISDYSNTPDLLREKCTLYGYRVINNWHEIGTKVYG